ncbi:MAG: hypothetical protein LUE92_03170 [Clostridiales bacterium]|nr:hypothetical protein [Clostridiales bacterium]
MMDYEIRQLDNQTWSVENQGVRFFLQINKTDHSGYYTVCDACKSSGVPYIHLNYASAKRCAGVMVEEIKKNGVMSAMIRLPLNTIFE